ncbi:hypothetical protein [Colwellia sp. E2M01]|uniref:hypothetical protein n=1 Tax=Colwellia sp. E2M01 TaxID=2841561 RepID=UPI001C09F1A9|nr:hypothetical protein [Colwellia sp. E2M01]MBU2869969.1 hypothetical protein [Colwellia sp. E2M01]
MKNIWMWPQTEINSKTITDNMTRLEEIEQYFASLYAPYKVVYFSRARVGMMAISAVKELARPQLTFVQPFSSHCVLSAISHLSTPTTTALSQSSQQVIYHQWGEKTQINQQIYNKVLIEDAVDSLILTNDKSELFPNNAPFCLISLPKVIPVSIGAIVVCQFDADYHKLTAQRMLMEQNIDKVLEQINIAPFKEATLQAKPMLTPVMEKSIKELVELSAEKIKANLVRIHQIFPQILNNVDQFNKRLPSNVVISQSTISQLALTEESLAKLIPFTIIEQQRSYFDYQRQQCEKVWLLPCHVQANWTE